MSHRFKSTSHLKSDLYHFGAICHFITDVIMLSQLFVTRNIQYGGLIKNKSSFENSYNPWMGNTLVSPSSALGQSQKPTTVRDTANNCWRVSHHLPTSLTARSLEDIKRRASGFLVYLYPPPPPPTLKPMSPWCTTPSPGAEFSCRCKAGNTLINTGFWQENEGYCTVCFVLHHWLI